MRQVAPPFDRLNESLRLARVKSIYAYFLDGLGMIAGCRDSLILLALVFGEDIFGFFPIRICSSAFLDPVGSGFSASCPFSGIVQMVVGKLCPIFLALT